ncbi:hypothetical protein FRC07_008318 [Ceratobasidium sp. 392]|nr:hypothetical protein FRC07_008318 [Ceratobasidium sp. 392]
MLQPQFTAALESTQSTRIVQLVTRLAEVLASDKVAIDDQHSPRLYSRFLSGVLSRQAQNAMVLNAPVGVGPEGGTGEAGALGANDAANTEPAQSSRSAEGASKGAASTAGTTSNTSANATDMGVTTGSSHTSTLEPGSEADEAQDEVLLPP